MSSVVKYDNMPLMLRNTRPISWLKGARKDFEDFPEGARTGARQCYVPTYCPTQRTSSVAGIAPDWRATSLLFLNRISVGMLRMA